MDNRREESQHTQAPSGVEEVRERGAEQRKVTHYSYWVEKGAFVDRNNNEVI